MEGKIIIKAKEKMACLKPNDNRRRVNTTAHTNTGRETMWFAWFMKLKISPFLIISSGGCSY
jgi:hypothetical protein